MLFLIQLVAFTTLEERLLDELLLGLQLGCFVVHVLEGAWSLESECILTIEGLLWKIVVAVLDVQLTEILLEVIIVIIYSRGVQVVIVEMLPTKGFWICWFLEIRLHFYWFFIGAAHGGLLLAYAFGGGLFLVLTRVVLPKFGQAILKVVLIIVLSCLLAIFGGWLWLPPAGGCVDGELLVDDGLFAESAL